MQKPPRTRKQKCIVKKCSKIKKEYVLLSENAIKLWQCAKNCASFAPGKFLRALESVRKVF